MRTLAAALLVALALTPAARAADVKLETEDQKTLYALGLALSRNLAHLQPDPDELATVEAGLRRRPLLEGEEGRPREVRRRRSRSSPRRAPRSSADKEKEAAKPFLEKMAQEKGAKKLPLRRHLHRGEGRHRRRAEGRPTR